MADLNEIKTTNNEEPNEMNCTDVLGTPNESKSEEVISDCAQTSGKNDMEVVNTASEELPSGLLGEPSLEKDDVSSAHVECLEEETSEGPKNGQETDEKPSDKQSIEVEIDSVSETLSEKIAQLDNLPKTESTENIVTRCNEEKKNSSNHVVRKVISLVEAYTDSSQSSSSEMQLSSAPYESSWSSQEKRINFENAIQPQQNWKETNDSLSTSTVEMKMDVDPVQPKVEQEEKPAASEIPVITIDENTQPPAPVKEEVSSENLATTFPTAGFPPPPQTEQPETNNTQVENNTEAPVQQPPPEVVPVPVVPPAPRKRGRPRKQVLPNPSPLVESWGPNAQEFPSLEAPKEERKRSTRPERNKAKKKKLEEELENLSKKRKSSQPPPKKKRRSTYVPKKKVQPPRKKHSEIENFQNFEEETRMSASEGHTGFSSRSGAAGDESQGSSATTEGPTRSNINKKGRMEVVTDGCKPVTVQQIVEYHWPPPSSLPHGEKSEGLMIQEQVCEYLGVKSFKRKYPSIKRRPVDMEERNYLQENGFVSENMCDLGLTAVFAADIIEIMYNDFPNKFEEYRKYTREKKAKEQRALREKQAAERADMDPKKEAVESTLSWNTEFNKTRRFRVLHRDPSERLLSDGFPCPANERVVLLHSPDNSALCVEDEYWKMTLFSYECEISSHTMLNKSRGHESQNIFVFNVGVLLY